MPTESEHETSLRRAVRSHYLDPDEEVTVRGVRTKSELDLGIAEGFYKNHDTWKDKSKEIIQDQFAKCESGQTKEIESPAAEKRSSLKRASPSTNSRPRKKSRLEEEDGESTALSEPPEEDIDEDVAPKKTNSRKQATNTTGDTKMSNSASAKKSTRKSRKATSTSDLSDAPSEDEPDSEEEEHGRPANATKADVDESSSELSSVIDDEPARKTKVSKTKNRPASKSNQSSTKSRSKSQSESDPKAEEIKRLQGWLVKCGIRKVWGKELKPFDSQNGKINYLKSMLSDAGMTGRYSNEKAAQIKEARELAADIEAVQEGNERWGKDGEEEEEEQGRGGRRLVRGAKNYAFLSSDGEEESD